MEDFKQLLDAENLVICVDDFGLTPGINQAVFELAQAGVINATSVMVDAKFLSESDIEKAVRLKHAGKLQIGLHLNFTELFGKDPDEEPVYADIRTHLLRSKLYSKSKVLSISQEIRRQFDRFEELFDSRPDFIDGHQHVHVLPSFFDALLDFYREHRLDHEDIWIRSLNRVNKLNNVNLKGVSKFKNFVLRFATKKAKSSLFSLRKELLGVYDFDCDKQEYEELFKQWLINAREYHKSTGRGAVIMCHPSVPESQIEGYDENTPNYYEDPIAKAREVEYEFFKEFAHNTEQQEPKA